MLEAVTLNVFVPAPLVIAGLKLALAPNGNPLRLKLTVPVPFVAARIFVKLTVFPAKTDCDGGVVVTAKLATPTLNERLFVHTPSVTEMVMSEAPV